MTSLKPIRRVRKDHTCRSLGLSGLDLCDMCDKCKHFQMRLDGLCGRRPGKLQIEKCEKHWNIPNGITKHTPYSLIEKKKASIEILQEYNYKVIDDSCEKESNSRLVSMSTSYRNNWAPQEATNSIKTNTDLIHSSFDEDGIESPSILGDYDALTEKTNTDFAEIPLPPPASIITGTPKEPVTLDDLLTLLYPRKHKRVRDIQTEWCEDQSRKRHKKYIHAEAKTLMLILKVMSTKNLSFAADILEAALKDNKELKGELERKENMTTKRSEQIVDSVKHFVKLRLAKSKTNQEKEALHLLIEACTYTNSEEDDHNSIRKMLGFSTGTFYRDIQEQSNGLDMTSYKHIESKKRKQTELSQKQEQCILTFCHSDESSTIDSNSKRLVEVIRDGKIERHVGRVWAVRTIDEQYTLFCESDTVADNLALNSDFKIPSRSYFYSHRCPCVALPTMQSCVDIKMSSCAHYMRAIGKYIRQNKNIRDKLTSQTWVPLLSGHAEDFVQSICCDKVPHPILVCGIGLAQRIPSFHPWDCLHGKCVNCGIEKMHKISDNTILTENNTEIDLLEWKEIARQGFKSNGTSRTQLELSRTKLAVKDVLKKMIMQLGICRLHVGQYQWINHARRLDLIMSNPDVSRVICTDFGALLICMLAKRTIVVLITTLLYAYFLCLRIGDECAISTKTKKYGMRQ